MRRKKNIINIFGIIIKWLGIFEILILLWVFIDSEAFYDVSETAAYLLSMLIFALLSFAGYKMEKSGKAKSAAVEGSVHSDLQKSQKALVERKVKKPVINRDGVVCDREYIYHFKNREDLFTGTKEEYAYPELSWNFQIAANLAKHILDEGGAIQSIVIGGGSDEVSHTGAVAYGNLCGTLETFVQNSMKDMETAEEEASKEYGGWFSSLNYSFIKVNAEIKDTEIKAEVSSLGSGILVGIQLGKGADGFLYLESLVHTFGAKDYEKGGGADRICWVSAKNVFQRSCQLDEEGKVFLTSCMDDNGIFTNYRLNIETQKDEHYQIIPEKIQDLLKLLKAEMSDEYFPNPAVACARYLSEHPVKDLTALLEKHDFLLFEHRKKDVAVIDSLANIFTSEKIERVFQTLEKLGFVLEKTEGNSELTSLLFSNNKNEKLDLGIEFKDEDILLYYNIYYTGEMLAQVCRILELLNEEAKKKRRFYLLG